MKEYGSYVVSDVMLCFRLCKGLTVLDGYYFDCVDWSREGTPYDLQVTSQYNHREYLTHSGRTNLDGQNGRHMMRWWNARQAQRDLLFMHVMTLLVA